MCIPMHAGYVIIYYLITASVLTAYVGTPVRANCERARAGKECLALPRLKLILCNTSFIFVLIIRNSSGAPLGDLFRLKEL